MRFALVLAGFGAATLGHTISFTSIGSVGTIDGAATPIGGISFADATGINFSLVDGTALRGVSKSISVHFSVDASAGDVLTQFRLVPVGFVYNLGTVKIDVDSQSGFYSQLDTYSQTAPALTTVHLPEQTFSLAPRHHYDVTANIDLLSPRDVQGFSIASDTHLAFIYSQQPVPEPATLSMLGAGLFAFIAKRRNRRDNH